MKRLVFVLLANASLSYAETDPRTGLQIADNWQLVVAHCGSCHDYSMVTAQRGDRDFWEQQIRWMQRTQGLWEIPAEQEDRILSYLATHYDEREWGRRPPLSPALMPAANRNSLNVSP